MRHICDGASTCSTGRHSLWPVVGGSCYASKGLEFLPGVAWRARRRAEQHLPAQHREEAHRRVRGGAAGGARAAATDRPPHIARSLGCTLCCRALRRSSHRGHSSRSQLFSTRDSALPPAAPCLSIANGNRVRQAGHLWHRRRGEAVRGGVCDQLSARTHQHHGGRELRRSGQPKLNVLLYRSLDRQLPVSMCPG